MAIMNIGGYQPNAYTYGNYEGYKNSIGIAPNGTPNADSVHGPGKQEDEKADGRFGIKKPGEKCETCENRKYQDGSNEHNVSFKAASHIAPEAAASAVRAHENQHVSNAYKKAEMDNGKVLRANVSIHTSICPECGRSYVSGGTTSTQIKYYNEENPYQKDLKTTDGVKYRGMSVDLTA